MSCACARECHRQVRRGDVGVECEHEPAFDLEVGVDVARERTDVEEQLGPEFRFVREVRVDVDPVGVTARFPSAAVEMVLAVLGEAFRESLPEALVGDDQVDVVADLATDAGVRRPPADEDRGLEVVPERVQQSAKAALIVCPENRHRPSPSWSHSRSRTKLSRSAFRNSDACQPGVAKRSAYV